MFHDTTLVDSWFDQSTSAPPWMDTDPLGRGWEAYERRTGRSRSLTIEAMIEVVNLG